MLTLEYNEELAREVAIEEAEERGKEELMKELIINMHNQQIPSDSIAKMLNIPIAKVESVISTIKSKQTLGTKEMVDQAMDSLLRL